MLFKFKSKFESDLIMLEFNARHVLQIIGKEPTPPGIILPTDMPAAIAVLEQAVAREEAALLSLKTAAHEPGDPHDPGAAATDVVPLRQRALPFINLLKACHSANTEIVWGV